MKTEMRYNPNKKMRPYEVFIRSSTQGWIFVEDFANELCALETAEKRSQLPDLPYIVRFENGTRMNANEL